jgi:hypothetical protein
MTMSSGNSQKEKGLTKFDFSSLNKTKTGGNGLIGKLICPHPKHPATENQVKS